MADEESAVESANTEPAAEQQATEENSSMESSSEKTFTASEMDAEIKRRIDKQNAKHNKELEQLRMQLEESKKASADTEAELAKYRHAAELSEWKAKAEAETGVAAKYLRGDTEEEIMEHAKQLTELPIYPQSIDSGANAPSSQKTNEAIFGEFMNQNFNI